MRDVALVVKDIIVQLLEPVLPLVQVDELVGQDAGLALVLDPLGLLGVAQVLYVDMLASDVGFDA